MDHVRQAYELSDEKKQLAKALYKQAVIELVNKNYVARVGDAHTELSAIFGVNWLANNKRNALFWLDCALYAEANVAFNYANFTLGMKKRFVATAKELVANEERVSDSELKKMAKQMDSILTATTAQQFEEHLMIS